MRVFIAIEPPEGVRRELGALQERLRRCPVRIDWTPLVRIHLTLRFLGEITEEQAQAVGDSLARGCTEARPFAVHVRGVGVFPSEKRPAVVWAGVMTLNESLNYLQQVAEGAAREIGLVPEEKGFQPHLTIGRVKDPHNALPLNEHVLCERNFDGGPFPVHEVIVFSSQLTPKGPIYRRLREIVL